MTDVVIIGGGTAGLTAAIYIQRGALQSTVLETEAFGGRIFPTLEIDNYPAMPGVSGLEYSEKLREQAEALGAVLLTQTAIQLTRIGANWRVMTRDGEITAKAVIFAAGEKQRQLGVLGETEFLGRGVSTCAACDGAFFRNKNVAIIGGGDKALDDALTLARMCESVHLIHRREEFRAAGGTVSRVKATANIVLHLNRIAVSINGARRVEEITLRRVGGAGNAGGTSNAGNVSSAVGAGGAGNTGNVSSSGGAVGAGNEEIEKLAVSGVFIAIGSDPQTELCAGLVQLDEQGYIIADEDCTTSTPGLFVAGDIRKKPLRQLVTAAADGAVAAKAATDYIIEKLL